MSHPRRGRFPEPDPPPGPPEWFEPFDYPLGIGGEWGGLGGNGGWVYDTEYLNDLPLTAEEALHTYFTVGGFMNTEHQVH